MKSLAFDILPAVIVYSRSFSSFLERNERNMIDIVKQTLFIHLVNIVSNRNNNNNKYRA
jgi:hypothetical protein